MSQEQDRDKEAAIEAAMSILRQHHQAKQSEDDINLYLELNQRIQTVKTNIMRSFGLLGFMWGAVMLSHGVYQTTNQRQQIENQIDRAYPDYSRQTISTMEDALVINGYRLDGLNGVNPSRYSQAKQVREDLVELEVKRYGHKFRGYALESGVGGLASLVSAGFLAGWRIDSKLRLSRNKPPKPEYGDDFAL